MGYFLASGTLRAGEGASVSNSGVEIGAGPWHSALCPHHLLQGRGHVLEGRGPWRLHSPAETFGAIWQSFGAIGQMEPIWQHANWRVQAASRKKSNLAQPKGKVAMACDIREPYILKAMGRAYSHVTASKGHIREDERHDIADRILAKASAGETSVERLVAFAIDPEPELRALLA